VACFLRALGSRLGRRLKVFERQVELKVETET